MNYNIVIIIIIIIDDDEDNSIDSIIFYDVNNMQRMCGHSKETSIFSMQH